VIRHDHQPARRLRSSSGLRNGPPEVRYQGVDAIERRSELPFLRAARCAEKHRTGNVKNRAYRALWKIGGEKRAERKFLENE
jgi:hypothetical protein